jgi:hypothetical protein
MDRSIPECPARARFGETKMTRLFYALIFCLLLAYMAFSQVPAGDADQYRLKGPVKSLRVEVSTISEKDGVSSESRRIFSSEFTFNSSGQLIESVINNYDGSPYVKYQALYNDKRKAEETYYKPKGDLIDKMVYLYGPDSRLVEKRVEKGKRMPGVISVFTYDDRGRLIENVQKGIKDSSAGRFVYSYDDAQNKIEETVYDLKGMPTNRIVNRYDKQFRLIEREYYFKEGPRVWKTTFSYDSNDNIYEETLNIIDAVSKWRYEYQLDSHNNWTKRITYTLANKDGLLKYIPAEVTFRTITYDTSSNESRAERPMDLGSKVITKETSSYLPSDPVKRQTPVYPAEAKRQRLTGKIEIRIMLDETGKVVSARGAADQPQLLSDAGTVATWDWKMNPIVRGGIAMKYMWSIRFNFTP